MTLGAEYSRQRLIYNEMNDKKSSYWKFVFGFFGLIAFGAAVFIAAFWFWPKSASTPPAPAKPQADEIVVTKLSNGDQLVENKTEGYKVTVPKGWYLENTHLGTTVYPDYDPTGVDQKISVPKCKLDINSFPVKNSIDLNSWITGHLHDDPTVTVEESSRTQFYIAGHPVVRWLGKLDGVKTLLVHIDGGNSKIYSIMPSTLDNGDVVTECDNYLQMFIINLRV